MGGWRQKASSRCAGSPYQERGKCGGDPMDSVISAAAQALASGDVLAALKQVALRDDPPALALRGIAMAQLGDFNRAKILLKRAAGAFRRHDAVAYARCVLAEAEIALVSRDLSGSTHAFDTAWITLATHGDAMNAAHARNLAARRLLLIGRPDEAMRALAELDIASLPPVLRASCALTIAGISIRRLKINDARAAFFDAAEAANRADIPALTAEVENASRILRTPVARAITDGVEQLVLLHDVESLLASGRLVIDACRNIVHGPGTTIRLATRPVLSALARSLGQGWPHDVPRDTLLLHAFRAKHTDESHRARLRVEIGRLRAALRPLAEINATKRGFILVPRRATSLSVLVPLVDGRNAAILALLADGESWSSSSLSVALGASPRTIQRALEQLAEQGKALPIGAGRARRWTIASVPGFPTTLLLPDVVSEH